MIDWLGFDEKVKIPDTVHTPWHTVLPVLHDKQGTRRAGPRCCHNLRIPQKEGQVTMIGQG